MKLIAELCKNHNGDIYLLESMVYDAVLNGKKNYIDTFIIMPVVGMKNLDLHTATYHHVK